MTPLTCETPGPAVQPVAAVSSPWSWRMWAALARALGVTPPTGEAGRAVNEVRRVVWESWPRAKCRRCPGRTVQPPRFDLASPCRAPASRHERACPRPTGPHSVLDTAYWTEPWSRWYEDRWRVLPPTCVSQSVSTSTAACAAPATGRPALSSKRRVQASAAADCVSKPHITCSPSTARVSRLIPCLVIGNILT
jgi:hypothetical protein